MATTEDMEELVMGCCGAVVWFPKNFLKQRREDGQNFYCPSGHARAFVKTKSDRLQEELTEARRSLQAKTEQLSSLKSGKCPFCWKTVKNLSAHIERMHS